MVTAGYVHKMLVLSSELSTLSFVVELKHFSVLLTVVASTL